MSDSTAVAETPVQVIPQTRERNQPIPEASQNPVPSQEAKASDDPQIQEAIKGDLSHLKPKEVRERLRLLALVVTPQQLKAEAAHARAVQKARPNTNEAYHAKQAEEQASELLKDYKLHEEKANEKLEKMSKSENPEERAFVLEIKEVSHKHELAQAHQQTARYRTEFVQKQKDAKPDIKAEEMQELLRLDVQYNNLLKAEEIAMVQAQKSMEERGALKNPDGTDIPKTIEPLAIEMAQVMLGQDEKFTEAHKQEVIDNPMGVIQKCLSDALADPKNAKNLIETLVDKKVIRGRDKKSLMKVFTGDMKDHLSQQILALSGLVSLLLYMFGMQANAEMGGGGR